MHIKGFYVSDNSYVLPNEDDKLLGFQKLNIFIGANNSGKSRFLRSIFGAKDDVLIFYDTLTDQLEKIYTQLSTWDDIGIKANLKHFINKKSSANYGERWNQLLDDLKNARAQARTTAEINVAEAIYKAFEDHNLLAPLEILDLNNRKHIYIPMLRGLRNLKLDSEKSVNDILTSQSDVYVNTTRRDYKWEGLSFPPHEIFSGQQMFRDILTNLVGKKNERQNYADFEQFVADHFFEEGTTLSITPDLNSMNLKLDLNTPQDRQIHNVGDGIQSILICIYKAFENRDKKTYLFIEEPEMTMHPGAQRVLMETLMSNKFPNLQIFVTTHSNHFLDITYDYSEEVSIYTFENIGIEKFRISNATPQSKILDLLGIRNSSVFLANSVIWTEGVTDRMLFRKLMKLTSSDPKKKSQKTFQEDYHYAFAEYGGLNGKNFSFGDYNDGDSVKVKSITKKNFIVADNDKKPEKNDEIRKALGDSFFDKHIEVENLLPFDVWYVVAQRLTANDRLGIRLQNDAKKNKEAFDEKLNKEKIGVLLKEYIVQKKDEDKELKYFKGDSIECLGKDKKTIMQMAIRVIEEKQMTREDLPETTQNLINSITTFIEKANE